MTILDILLIIVALAGVVFGYHRGILNEVASLFGIILGIIMCRIFGGTLSGLFLDGSETEHTRVTTYILCYVLIFVACYIGMRMISGTLKSMVSSLHLGLFDNVAGAIFKSLEWLFVLSIFLNVLLVIMPQSELKCSNDKMTELVYGFGPAVLGSDVVEEACRQAGKLEDKMREHAPRVKEDSVDVAGTVATGALNHALGIE
ncbi:MAG: CvpA family protein [Muribaculaceae bacterium]|nr:CvpA family protein [Muribaculaceae bacterium]